MIYDYLIIGAGVAGLNAARYIPNHLGNVILFMLKVELLVL